MGTAFIKIAAVYLLFGIGLGIYMGIAEEFQYTAVHAHINLLGWATTGLFGLIYHAFPRAGDGKMGKIHFWLHNIGTVMVLLGMFLFTVGEDGVAFPLAVSGSFIVLGATILFVANMFMNVKEVETSERTK